MCCVCEGGGIDYRYIYWYPRQWGKAIKAAVNEGKRTGDKHKVYKQVFAGGAWGWKIERYKQ